MRIYYNKMSELLFAKFIDKIEKPTRITLTTMINEALLFVPTHAVVNGFVEAGVPGILRVDEFEHPMIPDEVAQ